MRLDQYLRYVIIEMKEELESLVLFFLIEILFTYNIIFLKKILNIIFLKFKKVLADKY